MEFQPLCFSHSAEFESHLPNTFLLCVVVASVNKHLASVEHEVLKAVKFFYINNNASFWQGNIHTKFIGKDEALNFFTGTHNT
jgi:hypothetical protein